MKWLIDEYVPEHFKIYENDELICDCTFNFETFQVSFINTNRIDPYNVHKLIILLTKA